MREHPRTRMAAQTKGILSFSSFANCTDFTKTIINTAFRDLDGRINAGRDSNSETRMSPFNLEHAKLTCWLF